MVYSNDREKRAEKYIDYNQIELYSYIASEYKLLLVIDVRETGLPWDELMWKSLRKSSTWIYYIWTFIIHEARMEQYLASGLYLFNFCTLKSKPVNEYALESI